MALEAIAVTEHRHRPSPFSVLAASADALARADGPDGAVVAMLELAAAAVEAERSAVFVQHPDRADLELVASLGVPEAEIEQLSAAATHPAGPLVAAVRERQPAFGREAMIGEGGWTATDVPLWVTRDGVELVVGVATYAWPAGRGDEADDDDVLLAIGALMAVAVDRAQVGSLTRERSEWLERMAHTDPLTGLANARLLNRILELELARAGRQGSEVSVAVFDVDAFGDTNRDAGHAAGDDVLRQVAAVLAESVRLVDTVARYGGDEFIIVAPGPAGMTVARRVLEGVAALPEIGGRKVSVTAGVARFPADATEPEALVEAAVAALGGARDRGPGQLAEASPRGEGAPSA